MASLLDSILAESNGPKIIAEQHDKSKINWRNAITDPSEMMGAAASISSANRRANHATSNGRVCLMVARKPAWSELGVYVAECVNGKHAIKLASLDWRVQKVRHSYTYNGANHESNSWSVVRSDTGDELGVVGSKYVPLQNSDSAEFVDAVLQSTGAHYETAGALGNGSVVWFCARVPSGTFAVNGTDEQHQYLVIKNSHNGRSCINLFATNVRPECQNTLRQAFNGREKEFAIRHTRNAGKRVKECQRAMGMLETANQRFRDHAQQLGGIAVQSENQVRQYFDGVLDSVLDVTAAEVKQGAGALARALEIDSVERAAAEKRIERQIKRRGDMLESILGAWESDRCQSPGVKGTAWAAYNAVSDAADHAKVFNHYKGSERDRAESRFENLLTGRNDEIKQVAFSQALNLAT